MHNGHNLQQYGHPTKGPLDIPWMYGIWTIIIASCMLSCWSYTDANIRSEDLGTDIIEQNSNLH